MGNTQKRNGTIDLYVIRIVSLKITATVPETRSSETLNFSGMIWFKIYFLYFKNISKFHRNKIIFSSDFCAKFQDKNIYYYKYLLLEREHAAHWLSINGEFDCRNNGEYSCRISLQFVRRRGLTHLFPPFQHVLSERLRAPEVPPLCRETQSLGQHMLER